MIVELQNGSQLLKELLESYESCHSVWHEGAFLGAVYLRHEGEEGNSLFVPADATKLLVELAIRHGHDVLVQNPGIPGSLKIDGRAPRAKHLLEEALEK